MDRCISCYICDNSCYGAKDSDYIEIQRNDSSSSHLTICLECAEHISRKLVLCAKNYDYSESSVVCGLEGFDLKMGSLKDYIR